LIVRTTERCQVPKIQNGLRMLGFGLTLRGCDMGDSWNRILLGMRRCGRSSAGAEALTETQGQSDAPRGTGRLCLGELGASRFLRAAFWDSYRHAVGRCILAPLPPLSPLSPEYRGEGGNPDHGEVLRKGVRYE
jgi:hypothetical protein